MTDWLSSVLAWTLARCARALPAGRRDWGEAVRAEASQVPAGWLRLRWLAGGLRLVVREISVTRRIRYGLGAALVAAVVAWAAWLSWQHALPGDADRLVDRVRVIQLAAVLAVLPWAARRRGIFGPGGTSTAMRLLRIGGCALLCATVLSVVHLDQTSPWVRVGDHEPGGAAGNFRLSGEILDLVMLAVLLTVALALSGWQRTRIAAVVVAIAGTWIMFWLGPFQLFTVLYAAGILAATSRRSGLTPASLGIGAAAGVAASLLAGLIKVAAGLPAQATGIGGLAIAENLSHLGIAAPILLLASGGAALLAARRSAATGRDGDIDWPRIRQGMGAGLTAGAVAGLMITILAGWWPVLFLSPLLATVAALYGARIGAGLAPAHDGNRTWLGGVFAASLTGPEAGPADAPATGS